MQKTLNEYCGAKRRFELKADLGNNILVYDDYSHHPTEIKATLSAAKQKHPNKIIAIFQPHTYSRTKNLLDDFANALINFDNIIVLDIYAAREKNTYGITSKDLVNRINSIGKESKYIPDFNDCVKYVKDNVQKDDIVITLGAGTVTQIGPMLVD